MNKIILVSSFFLIFGCSSGNTKNVYSTLAKDSLDRATSKDQNKKDNFIDVDLKPDEILIEMINTPLKGDIGVYIKLKPRYVRYDHIVGDVTVVLQNKITRKQVSVSQKYFGVDPKKLKGFSYKVKDEFDEEHGLFEKISWLSPQKRFKVSYSKVNHLSSGPDHPAEGGALNNPNVIFFVDINFDDSLDIVIPEFATGQRSRGVYFIYEIKNNEFVEFPMEMDSLTYVDLEKKVIHQNNSSGQCSQEYITYRFANGSYSLDAFEEWKEIEGVCKIKTTSYSLKTGEEKINWKNAWEDEPDDSDDDEGVNCFLPEYKKHAECTE